MWMEEQKRVVCKERTLEETPETIWNESSYGLTEREGNWNCRPSNISSPTQSFVRPHHTNCLRVSWDTSGSYICVYNKFPLFIKASTWIFCSNSLQRRPNFKADTQLSVCIFDFPMNFMNHFLSWLIERLESQKKWVKESNEMRGTIHSFFEDILTTYGAYGL